jgi:hypothetical protein
LRLVKDDYICSPLIDKVEECKRSWRIYFKKGLKFLKINLVVRKRICTFAARK